MLVIILGFSAVPMLHVYCIGLCHWQLIMSSCHPTCILSTGIFYYRVKAVRQINRRLCTQVGAISISNNFMVQVTEPFICTIRNPTWNFNQYKERGFSVYHVYCQLLVSKLYFTYNNFMVQVTEPFIILYYKKSHSINRPSKKEDSRDWTVSKARTITQSRK